MCTVRIPSRLPGLIRTRRLRTFRKKISSISIRPLQQRYDCSCILSVAAIRLLYPRQSPKELRTQQHKRSAQACTVALNRTWLHQCFRENCKKVDSLKWDTFPFSATTYVRTPTYCLLYDLWKLSVLTSSKRPYADTSVSRSKNWQIIINDKCRVSIFTFHIN